MTSQIRMGPATDADRYLATDQMVWFEEVPTAATERLLLGVPEHLRFAADVPGSDPGTYPGIYGVRPMTLTIPGGDRPRVVPCAGLTWVGVHPDHRRQGILTAMLRHHFEQVRDEPGTLVSALHASEPTIYGRHGYGLASLEVSVALGRGTALVAPHLEDQVSDVRTQLTALGDTGLSTRLRDSELRAAAGDIGSIVGDPGYYAGWCDELPEQLRNREPGRVLFAVRDGVDIGHAIFRRKQKWKRARPGGELTVQHLAGTPVARLALLRRLVDFDLISSVRVEAVGVDDPLLSWIGGPRGAQDVQTYDSLWVRLVNLPEALVARTYSASCDLVVEIEDRSAPWNAGRWRVRIDPTGTAEVERTDHEADVRLPVQALGAAYLGGGSLAAMQRAGLVREQRPGAVAALSRAMRTDPAPGAAIGF